MERKTNTTAAATMPVEVTVAAGGSKRQQLTGSAATMPVQVTAAAGGNRRRTEAVHKAVAMGSSDVERQRRSMDTAAGDHIDEEGRVYSLALSYSLLGEASENLRTFQGFSRHFPGTPFSAATRLVASSSHDWFRRAFFASNHPSKISVAQHYPTN